MLGLFKKNTADLVKEWNTVYTNHVIGLPKEERDAIVNYVSNNKKELSVVLNSLTETARLKNGDKISKNLFFSILEWIDSLVWTALINGVKTGIGFRKSYDYVFEAYKFTHTNPEEALAMYKEIVGDKD